MTNLVLKSGSVIEKNNLIDIIENALAREERLLMASLSKTEENLAQFEKQYQMSSKVFFDQYQSGKTDDRNDF